MKEPAFVSPAVQCPQKPRGRKPKKKDTAVTSNKSAQETSEAAVKASAASILEGEVSKGVGGKSRKRVRQPVLDAVPTPASKGRPRSRQHLQLPAHHLVMSTLPPRLHHPTTGSPALQEPPRAHRLPLLTPPRHPNLMMMRRRQRRQNRVGKAQPTTGQSRQQRREELMKRQQNKQDEMFLRAKVCHVTCL